MENSHPEQTLLSSFLRYKLGCFRMPVLTADDPCSSPRCCCTARRDETDENTAEGQCDKSSWANYWVSGQRFCAALALKGSNLHVQCRLPHRQNVDWTLSRVWIHECPVGWVCHSVPLLARTTSWWCTSSWTGILKWGLSRFDVTTWAKWITRSRSSRLSRPWSKALPANWNKVLAILPDPGKRRNLQDGGIHHQLISHCNSI